MLSPRTESILIPDRLLLLAMLSEEVDDEMLREIAEADYNFNVDEHLRHLVRIRDEKEIPVPLNWEPKEVLELTKWSEPDAPDSKSGATGRRGHLMRAFCCAALLISGAEQTDQEAIEGENCTLIQLLESLKDLGALFQAAGLSLVAWRLCHLTEKDEERPFFLLAALVLAIEVVKKHRDEVLSELSRLLLDEEKLVRSSEWAVLPDSSSQWLLGLTFYNQKATRWAKLGDDIQAASVDEQIAGAKPYLETIVYCLSGGCVAGKSPNKATHPTGDADG
jgi:hypothetical protein